MRGKKSVIPEPKGPELTREMAEGATHDAFPSDQNLRGNLALVVRNRCPISQSSSRMVCKSPNRQLIELGHLLDVRRRIHTSGGRTHREKGVNDSFHCDRGGCAM